MTLVTLLPLSVRVSRLVWDTARSEWGQWSQGRSSGWRPEYLTRSGPPPAPRSNPSEDSAMPTKSSQFNWGGRGEGRSGPCCDGGAQGPHGHGRLLASSGHPWESLPRRRDTERPPERLAFRWWDSSQRCPLCPRASVRRSSPGPQEHEKWVASRLRKWGKQQQKNQSKTRRSRLK